MILKLIKEIKKLELTAGQPFNSVKLKKIRKELTEKLLNEGKELLEVENYVLKVNYINKDKSKPYTSIYTKESFKNYKNYGQRRN